MLNCRRILLLLGDAQAQANLASVRQNYFGLRASDRGFGFGDLLPIGLGVDTEQELPGGILRSLGDQHLGDAGQRIQRRRIQAVAEDLRPAYDPLLHIEMELDPAPAEALVQLMAERRRMAEVPLPAALAGEGLARRPVGPACRTGALDEGPGP